MNTVLILSLATGLCAAAVGSLSAEVIMLSDRFEGSSGKFYERLAEEMSAAGFTLREVEGTALARTLDARTGPGVILVLPDSRRFPVEARESLQRFLKRGNHLLAVSGPPLGQMAVRWGERWLTRDELSGALAETSGVSVVDFQKEDISGWRRASGSEHNPTKLSLVDTGIPEAPRALRVEISRLDDWDSVISRRLTRPFPSGHSVTLFRARGGPNTPELVVEWRERDGCRWMAVVRLTTEWKNYALRPPEFRYWSDNPALGRGGPGDRFKPENAEVISFAVASGISVQRMGIPHSYEVADIRAAVDPFAEVDFSQPVLESLSPAYKTYRTYADVLRPVIPGLDQVETGASVVCALPRSPGYGSDGLRQLRFIPVVQAETGHGEHRGAAAHILLNSDGEFARSAWGYIGLDQDFLEQNPETGAAVAVHILRRIAAGVFLANAGTDRFGYPAGDPVKTGAFVVNLGRETVSAEVEFRIDSAEQGRRARLRRAAVPAGGEAVFTDGGEWSLEPGEHTVRTRLFVGGVPVDEISHSFNVVGFAKIPVEEVVTVRDGHFYLAGEKWHALGVNYWPRYSTGLENPDWVRWALPDQYNPDIIEQDLDLARKLGINTLSVQYTTLAQAPAMLDFAERCRRRDIKLHVFIPGVHPLSQNFPEARKLIEAARLHESPAMFAYDVGWEVHIGRYDRRREFDPLWHRWVVDQYGSVDNAERDWGYRPDRIDGEITGPSDKQLMEDGNWRVYVAAYRRFWDDEISKRYRQVREFLRGIDPHHLICARSGYGGTGSKGVVDRFPFDLASGAKHLDFTSPEAYGISGDRSNYIHGGFTTEYGRFVSGGKPVFWAEYGVSVWPRCDEEALEIQRELYQNTLQMIRESYASGSAAWWWPGGFRVGENSDYGIVNPDGTPRPSALEIAAFAASFTPRDLPAHDTHVTIDRDLHVTGYAGVYEAAREEYVRAVENGLFPGIRTAGTGTDSTSVTLVQVGNVGPDGSGPPKFLNAEFNWLRINGVEAENGAAVEVERGKPVFVEASAGNTQEAKWVAPQGSRGQGTVWLKAHPTGSPESAVFAPIESDTAFLEDAVIARTELSPGLERPTEFTFRMTAYGRADFGEIRRVRLVPR